METIIYCLEPHAQQKHMEIRSDPVLPLLQLAAYQRI